MSVFQQNLPIQIIPIENNEQGLKYQGLFDSMEPDSMKIKMDDTFFEAKVENQISVEFSMSNFNFQFESILLPKRDGNCIHIAKPKVIHKSQIRKAQRLKTNIKFNYTIWTEGGRYEGTITDLSVVGIKIFTQKELRRNTLVSINVYVPGHDLRFICQGLVKWVKQDADYETDFTCGIMFTTLSIDSMKKVDKFIKNNMNNKSSIVL
ncbi:MAG: PilZ domain-containing protein [Leptospira sp.]|nr:PilZ domain-containing protein [Leptospira sp.]